MINNEEMESMGTITVASSITRKYQPDTVVFGIRVSKVADTSKELAAYNKEVVDRLLGKIAELEIDEDNFREENFRIDVNRVYEDNKYVEKGYRLDSRYSITFYIDYDLIDSVRGMLSEEDIAFNVEYKIDDETAIREEMLADVIKESKRKALIIAKAGDAELKEILSVRYQSRAEAAVFMRAKAASDAMPEDIDITESAEVDWAINAREY